MLNACMHIQVMARDDFRCFMSGGLDSRAYYAGRPVPPGARVKFCDTVPILSSDVWAHDVPAGQDREHQSESSQVRRLPPRTHRQLGPVFLTAPLSSI